MWLEAIVTREDLATFASELAPVTVKLGDNGELRISDPRQVEIVPERGVRVSCTVLLQWDVLGFTVPIRVQSLTVLLRPEVVQRATGKVLVFGLELEQTDLAGAPTLIDERVRRLVNHELAQHHVEPAWDFVSTLTHEFDLPAALRPAERLAISADDARVKATRDALGLALDVRVDVLRQGQHAAALARVSPPPVEPAPARVVRVRRPSLAWPLVAVLSGVALMVVGYSAGKARAARPQRRARSLLTRLYGH